MKILGHRERGVSELGMSVKFTNGPKKGETFRQVEAALSDGSHSWLWVSDKREGYFKQSFVPWDFKHVKIIP